MDSQPAGLHHAIRIAGPILKLVKVAPLVLIVASQALLGCQGPRERGTAAGPVFTPSQEAPLVAPLDVKSLSDTIRIEWQDRVDRLRRLSQEYGIQAPAVQEDLQVNPGAIAGVSYSIPVIRVVYQERMFFDFDKDQVRPDAERLLDVIAESVKRDLPDTQLLILGHTDSVGSASYNDDLSARRAANVMQALARRGVPLEQLATVAIGERQPVATNATEEGRAQNRRVEFMISARHEANLKLVEEREINANWLDSHELRSPIEISLREPGQAEVTVLRPTRDILTRVPNEISVRDLRPERQIALREPRVIQAREFQRRAIQVREFSEAEEEVP